MSNQTQVVPSPGDIEKGQPKTTGDIAVTSKEELEDVRSWGENDIEKAANQKQLLINQDQLS